jgi:coupling of ubiquitin conjugation to ER degradation protein 1
MAEQSINIPQVLVFLVVTFLAIRWYFSKPSTAGTRAAPTRAPTRINPAQIDTIASMFPQLSRRDIAWDLQRNGGNATATTERVLSGRGLDTVSTRRSQNMVEGLELIDVLYRRLRVSISLRQHRQ